MLVWTMWSESTSELAIGIENVGDHLSKNRSKEGSGLLKKREHQLKWVKGPEIKVTSRLNVKCRFEELPERMGVYCIVRMLQSRRDVLYVGYSSNLRKRLIQHARQVPIMQHVHESGRGKKFIVYVHGNNSSAKEKAFRMIEKALIQYFTIHGSTLHNKKSTRLDFESIQNAGAHKALNLPQEIYWKRSPSVEVDKSFLLLDP